MEFIFENHMLVGLGIILVISFVGLIILQWIAEKTGVKTDKLQEGLKEVNETAQVEAVKELKKTVEKMTEPKTIETQPDESVTIKPQAKKQYAVRDETGKFAKVETAETPKRKAGRPRKVQK